MRKTSIRILFGVAAGLICLALQLASPAKSAVIKNTFHAVKRVIDGDTIQLSDNTRVRLIGVDTPEVHFSNKLLRDSRKTGRDISSIQEMGKRSSEFLKKLIGPKRVRLEYDVEKKDRYGRTLAYVYLDDGTFVNARILEEGYGQVMTIPPNVRFADYFLKLQREARASNRGLWKE